MTEQPGCGDLGLAHGGVYLPEDRMVVTERFIYIHQPKTGGTFVETVLSRLYPPEVLLPHWRGRLRRLLPRVSPGRSLQILKHGRCRDIPLHLRNRALLATVRSPYDRFVSQYEFGAWKEHPEWWVGGLPKLRAECPAWPSVSFDQFVHICDRLQLPLDRRPAGDLPALGLQTRQFMSFFCRGQCGARGSVSREDCLADLRARMYPIRFLPTHKLSRALYEFVIEQGVPQADAQFVLSLGRIRPPGGGRDPERGWGSYYTPELKRFVRDREWPVFELFPELDI